jgi:hypothetical protein
MSLVSYKVERKKKSIVEGFKLDSFFLKKKTMREMRGKLFITVIPIFLFCLAEGSVSN